MGESACLVRSFSQPAEIYSCGNEEGDPVRALTESVSFGRFMSESLAWEKWSTFSHNRYLEEVEKFAKPGSVAQKKAFFEAHYKKRAAMKATQAKLEEANVASIAVPGDENAGDSQNVNPVDSQVAPMVTTSMVIDEVRQGEICGTEEDRGVDVSSGSSISEMEVETDVEAGKVKDYPMENLEQLEIAESRVEVGVPEDKVLNEGNPTSSSKERRVCSSSGSKAPSEISRLTPSRARGLDSSHERSEADATSSSKKSISVAKKQKRSPVTSFHTSINVASSCGKSNKELLQISRKSPRSSTNAKAAVEADKTKRSVPSSAHMSINFASSPRPMSKTWQKIPLRSSTAREASSSLAKSTPRGSTRTKAEGEADKKKRLVPSSVQMSINYASSPLRKMPIRSSSRRETTSCMAENSPRCSTSAKAAGEADKKKISAPSSVQMSINLTSPRPTSKTGQKLKSSTIREATSSKAENNALPAGGKARMGASGSQNGPLTCSFRTSINLRSHVSGTTKTSPRVAKDDSSSTRCSTSASVIRLPKLPPKNQLTEDKRKNTIVGGLISVRILDNQKTWSSVNHSKLSTPSGSTKARSCTVSSPFSFRSDERARKRKEFFKKLEEKNKNEEAAKDQMPSGSKIPLTRLCSPRQRRNQSLCLNNNGKSHRRLQNISSAITENTEHAAGEKQRNSKIHPSNPLPKRKTLENLSPNIQQ